MPHYLAVFTGSPDALASWEALSEQERNARHDAGVAAWKQWVADKRDAIVEMGGPLGKTKRVNKSGVADIRNNLAAFTIVRADSHEAAAQLFIGHPHFMLFPGDGVEIMPVMPVPAA